MGLLDSILRRRRPRPPSMQTVISRRIGKAIAGLIIAGAAALFGLKNHNNDSQSTKGLTVAQKQASNINVEKTSANYEILTAIKNFKELKFVTIKNAQVVKLLRNDNKGARHQRWVVQIEEGTTITIVYNIDLAQKVPLSAGDIIEVAGELVFGDRKKDPIIHWTHADPQKRRPDGYVIHNGKRYGDLI